VVKSDGTFTGSGTASDPGDDAPDISGSFSLSSSGFLMNMEDPNCLCQVDLGKTVMACTVTWINGSPGTTDLIVGVKQSAPTSYSMNDLAGNWEANFLDGGPYSASWERISGDKIDSHGNFKGSYSNSAGAKGITEGQLALSKGGQVTEKSCISGSCPDSNWTSYMDASKTVMVGTYGAATNSEDAVLTVFTKMASSGSYSMTDLVGVWQLNSLASGPGAPWWERGTFTIKPDGTVTANWTESNSNTHKGVMTLSLSSDGVITCSDCKDPNIRMVMDAGKTVIVGTDTWAGNTDPGTTTLGILTKSEGVPGAPTIETVKAGNGEATVTFTAPALNGGSPITGYTVTSKPKGGDDIDAGKTSTEHTVTGLKNGTSYTFTVTAKNKIGTGPPSAASKPVTPEK